MNEKNQIFLSPKQAIEAIHIDFNQYDIQFDLFQELCPIITNNKSIVTKKGRDTCVLITRGQKSKIRHMKTDELGNYLYKQLVEKSYPLSVLAVICSKVFQTSTSVSQGIIGGADGIVLETEMGRFTCRQCGNCCLNLSYRNDCTKADYSRWESLDRKDILEKVLTAQTPGREIEYKIWKKPGTRMFHSKCPWLVSTGQKTRYACRIHDLKPDYCRQYPLTRKHALMTGCKGTFK